VRGAPVLALALGLSACAPPSGPPAAKHVSTTTSTTVTTPAVAASGVRTVLSPIGLNVRSQPSKTAPILRTAGRGAVLTVLARTDGDGGWFEVKGPTVTGWMSSDPTLSASGTFGSYDSTVHQVSLLYPQGWTTAELPPDSVVFRPPSGSDTVVVTTATTIDQIVRGRSGYHQTSSEQVVVCGVTGDLVTFVATGATTTTSLAPGVVAEQNFSQVRLALDPQHALDLEANYSAVAQLPIFQEIVSSVTFPFPQCQPAGQ